MKNRHKPYEYAQAKERLARLYARFSSANRAAVEQYVVDYYHGGSLVTPVAVATSLLKLDAWLGGRAMRDISPADLREYVTLLSDRVMPATVRNDCINIKTFLRRVHGVPRMPEPIEAACRRPRRGPRVDYPLVTEQERDALLGACAGLPSANARLMWQAMVWTFWDSGFRRGELQSLRVSAVSFAGPDMAKLALREGDYGLKTGPRTVDVSECVRALRAWITVHPLAHTPDGYLFPNDPDAPTTELNKAVMWRHLNRLCSEAGVRRINPHSFRHTRATRAARANWNESKMRAFFGWSLSSPMPAYYTHLAALDLEEQVRRDVGLDDSGQAVRQKLTKAEVKAALMDRLAKLLADD